MDRKSQDESIMFFQSSGIIFQVVSNTLEGIIIADQSGLIQSVNHACTVITGYPLDEMVAKNLYRFLNPRAPEGWSEKIKGIIEETGVWEGNIVNFRKNGTSFPSLARIIRIHPPGEGNSLLCGYISDISMSFSPEDAQKSISFHDPLTRLPSPSLLINRLHHAIQLAKRNFGKIAILYLKFTGIQHARSVFGSEIEQTLLMEISKKLSSILRVSDTIARMEEDEFIIVLENISTSSGKGAKIVSQKILEIFQEPILIKDQPVMVPVRIGISQYPMDGADPESLISKAKRALLRAKEAYKDQVAFYSEAEYPASLIQSQLFDQLKTALQKKELILEYQPVVDAVSHHINSLEALIRWDHPQAGRLSPDEFLPLAESTGLILPVGDWVIRSACQQTQSLLRTDIPRLGVSVNLSQRQLEYSQISSVIMDALKNSGLPAHLLTIELSENLLVQKLEETRNVMQALRDLGVRITIDNFGKGFSSLNILKSLPLQAIKIDRSFISLITTDLASLSMVQGLISVGQHLNAEVIAEGVETIEQAELLAVNGCHSLQGYFFSHPLRISELRGKLNIALPWTL